MQCICDKIPRQNNTGDIVNIYITKTDGTRYLEGEVILSEFISENTEAYPLIEECRGCGKQINITREKWAVYRTDDPFIKNVRLVRNVDKFHSYGTITINTYNESEDYELVREYCVDYLENDPYLCTQLKKEVFGKGVKTQLYKDFLVFKNGGPFKFQQKSK